MTWQKSFGSARFQQKIQPEDKVIFKGFAPFVAHRQVLLPGRPDAEGVVVVKTHVRREDLDRETFQRRWRDEYARFVADKLASSRWIRRYEQLHNIGPVTSGESFFHPSTAGIDGIMVMAFTSMRHAESLLVSEEYAAITLAERAIAREGAGEFWTGINFNVR